MKRPIAAVRQPYKLRQWPTDHSRVVRFPVRGISYFLCDCPPGQLLWAADRIRSFVSECPLGEEPATLMIEEPQTAFELAA